MLDAWQQTPLLVAAERGHEDIAILLLRAGANPHSSDAEERTSLHHAAAAASKELVEYLVKEAGANINAKVGLAFKLQRVPMPRADADVAFPS